VSASDGATHRETAAETPYAEPAGGGRVLTVIGRHSSTSAPKTALEEYGSRCGELRHRNLQDPVHGSTAEEVLELNQRGVYTGLRAHLNLLGARRFRHEDVQSPLTYRYKQP